MTNEELLLQRIKSEYAEAKAKKEISIETSLDRKDINMILNALEKQIPKKPNSVDIDYGVFVCPTCRNAIYRTNDLSEHKHCLNCGQAIDWSDSDDE